MFLKEVVAVAAKVVAAPHAQECVEVVAAAVEAVEVVKVAVVVAASVVVGGVGA